MHTILGITQGSLAFANSGCPSRYRGDGTVAPYVQKLPGFPSRRNGRIGVGRVEPIASTSECVSVESIDYLGPETWLDYLLAV